VIKLEGGQVLKLKGGDARVTEAAQLRFLSDFYNNLSKKYAKGASAPWAALPPDPKLQLGDLPSGQEERSKSNKPR
jgi:hypothetical protein